VASLVTGCYLELNVTFCNFVNIFCTMSRPKLPPLKERVAEVTVAGTGEDAHVKPRKKKKIDNGTIEAV